MSGLFTHRVNRVWSKTFAGISAAVYFHEWLKFFSEHPGFSFVAYGTGKSQTGEEPPSTWVDWDPTLSGTVPWSDNSWFVVNADKASNELSGSGQNQWQAKFQTTQSTGFDDCNVADTDYDWEGTTYCNCLRASKFSGWDETLLDFAPSGGEAASHNFNIDQGSNDIFGLDIISDDDSIFWRNARVTSSLTTEGPPRSRGGYLGMLIRNNASVNPFLLAAGRNFNEIWNYGYRSVNSCHDNNPGYYSWHSTSVIWDGTTLSYSWPSYSIGRAGNEIRRHRIETFPKTDIARMSWSPGYGEIINWGMRVAQWLPPDDYAIIGQLRFLASIGYQHGHGVRYGDDLEWLQFTYQGDTNTGIGMKWPVGVVNVW